MSTSETGKLQRYEALRVASDLIELLVPDCDRIEMAGSLRRGKPEVGDIELVAIPRQVIDLFGHSTRHSLYILTDITRKGYRIVKGGDKYIQFEASVRGTKKTVMVDLFLTTPEQWGIIFMIRTGSANFSHRLVSSRLMGGMLPVGFSVRDGFLWSGDQLVKTFEEEDVFKALGTAVIPPGARE